MSRRTDLFDLISLLSKNKANQTLRLIAIKRAVGEKLLLQINQLESYLNSNSAQIPFNQPVSSVELFNRVAFAHKVSEAISAEWIKITENNLQIELLLRSWRSQTQSSLRFEQLSERALKDEELKLRLQIRKIEDEISSLAAQR